MEERGMGIGESLLIHNINHMYGATGGGENRKRKQQFDWINGNWEITKL
jgi:hypothetical protein